MVDAGFARIRPFAGEVSCLSRLPAPENAARPAGRGLSQNPEFSVVSACDPSYRSRISHLVIDVGGTNPFWAAPVLETYFPISMAMALKATVIVGIPDPST